jgi:cell division protein FtsW
MRLATRRSRSGAGRPARSDGTRAKARVPPPLEHRILLTAALCLLAFGAVMVYSASSPIGVLHGTGSGTSQFVRYLAFGGLGLIAMQVLERRGLQLLTPQVVNLMLIVSFVLLVAVMVPGLGVRILGARRWLHSGPFQFQPSEVMKLALVLWTARYLTDNPKRVTRPFKDAIKPFAVIAGPAFLLIAVEPDLGTTLVIVSTLVALLVAGGLPLRHLMPLAAIAVACVAVMVTIKPYEMTRLTSFLNSSSPSCQASACYQSMQGQIALGSGGMFGVGLGKSVQKDLYLPEAQTDFILAVIGEELGIAGIFGVVLLYGMIAYAGFRTARRAGTRYAKLLAAGLTSLILCQGTLNIFVVLGLAPLTGVPLPFISYAPTNLCVMLACIGLLLNISRPGVGKLRALDGDEYPIKITARESPEDRDRRRRDRRARRAGAGGGRRPAS